VHGGEVWVCGAATGLPASGLVSLDWRQDWVRSVILDGKAKPAVGEAGGFWDSGFEG